MLLISVLGQVSLERYHRYVANAVQPKLLEPPLPKSVPVWGVCLGVARCSCRRTHVRHDATDQWESVAGS